MLDVSGEFGPFQGRVWLNCAHQGPLPRRAAEEAREAVRWKTAPWELTQERFHGVPTRLRENLGRLLGVPAEEVILGNSASYGLHLLANSFPWREGDEVLVVRGDFPSDILPWLTLEDRGVTVRYVEPANHLPEPEELEASLTPRTRLFCTTWVHSFSGVTADLTALGELCRERGVAFVVNGSQAVGARPLAVGELPVDALVGVGFKWLCGPYGTGYCWVRPDLLRTLRPRQAYWLAALSAQDLTDESLEIGLPAGPPRADTFDLFGTANFFNFHPWAAAIEVLLGHGIERIAAHDQALVERLLAGLDPEIYEVLSPREGPRRSTLVFVSHRDRERNPEIHAALGHAGIDVALRRGALRIAPHVYNAEDDIDRALAALQDVGRSPG